MDIFEADFSEQIKASLTTKCDNCGKQLGESYPRGKDVMEARLSMGTDESGYDNLKHHHFCNEGCIRAHLNTRAEKAEKGK